MKLIIGFIVFFFYLHHWYIINEWSPVINISCRRESKFRDLCIKIISMKLMFI